MYKFLGVWLIIMLTLISMIFTPSGAYAQSNADDNAPPPVYLPLILTDNLVDLTSEEEETEDVEVVDLDEIAPLDETSVQAAAAGSQKLGVPAYFYPGEAPGDAYWTVLENSSDTVGIIILNPNSGAGSAIEANYTAQVDRLQNKNKTYIGYVDTVNGARPIAQVKAEIDNYYNWYDVDGIYLDRTPTSCSARSYYQELTTYVKAKSPQGIVALGFGSDFEDCMMNFDNTVIGVNFIDTFAAYQSWQPGPTNNTYPASRIWHMIYGTSRANLESAVALTKARNAGKIFITDDVDPNPWDTLPNTEYWNKELELAVSTGSTVRVYPIPGNIVRATEDRNKFQIGGYVYVNGTPVAGARITITDQRNNSITYDTNIGEQVTGTPYYLTPITDISGFPRGTVRVTATYAGQSTPAKSYKIISGMQQIDFVLPGNGSFTAPIATINYRSHLNSFTSRETLVLNGSGQASIKTSKIKKYIWKVNGQVKSNSKTLKLAGKSQTSGQYTITFIVEDQFGIQSSPVEITYTRR